MKKTLLRKTTPTSGSEVFCTMAGHLREICKSFASSSTGNCMTALPSHLAQMWKDRTYSVMTEMNARMTVHPGFPMRLRESSRVRNVIRAELKPHQSRSPVSGREDILFDLGEP